MGSSFSKIPKVDRKHYKQFVLLTQTNMRQNTLGQTFAQASFEVEIYYVHTNANRQTMIDVLNSIVEALEEDKYRVKGMLEEVRAKTTNQLNADLNGIIYAATKEYAKKDRVSFPDLLYEWKWALETISQALEDDTLDGNECDPTSSDEDGGDSDEDSEDGEDEDGEPEDDTQPFR